MSGGAVDFSPLVHAFVLATILACSTMIGILISAILGVLSLFGIIGFSPMWGMSVAFIGLGAALTAKYWMKDW